jgi:pimeloyl-ACP methyl ester carboxylesterase
MEVRIAGLWCRLLSVDQVSVHDTFFDLGGDSLSSAEFCAMLKAQTGMEVSPGDLGYQTLGQLAAALDQAAVPAAASPAAVAAPPSPVEAVAAGADRRRPLHFGRTAGELFGLMQLPASGEVKDTAVVLCPPFGLEYIRSHRAFVTLGSRLAAKGLATLRLDYFGCGDSAGESEDGTVERWVEDVCDAVDEARRQSGARAVSLVGLRLGAAVAALAAAQRSDVDRLVLWDPIISGREYLGELRAGHRRWLAHAYATSRCTSTEEAFGFPLHERLRGGIVDIDISLAAHPARRLLVLETGERARLAGGNGAASAERPGLELCHLLDRRVWLEDPSRGVVPVHVFEKIVTWLVSS